MLSSCFLFLFLVTTFLKVECSNPSLLPEPGQRRSIEEPFVKVCLIPLDLVTLCNLPHRVKVNLLQFLDLYIYLNVFLAD